MAGGWVLPGSRVKKDVEKDDITSHKRTFYRGLNALQEGDVAPVTCADVPALDILERA